MKIKRIVFAPLIEDGKPVVRRPMGGDWIESDRSPYKVRFDNEFATNRPILVRTEEEVEVPDPPVVYEWAVTATNEWRDADEGTAEFISRHAAEVSPERLCEMIVDYENGRGGVLWEMIAKTASSLKATWVRR